MMTCVKTRAHSWSIFTMQYSTIQYSPVQYSTVQYSTVHYSTVQYSTVQYSTVQYSTVQYWIQHWIQYRTAKYSKVQFPTGLCWEILSVPNVEGVKETNIPSLWDFFHMPVNSNFLKDLVHRSIVACITDCTLQWLAALHCTVRLVWQTHHMLGKTQWRKKKQ